MGGSELLAVVLLTAVGILTTAMLYLGLTGLLGGLFFVRCRCCEHWTLSFSDATTRSCTHCRHTTLLHPLRALHTRH
jgi:hypothetical protein